MPHSWDFKITFKNFVACIFLSVKANLLCTLIAFAVASSLTTLCEGYFTKKYSYLHHHLQVLVAVFAIPYLVWL